MSGTETTVKRSIKKLADAFATLAVLPAFAIYLLGRQAFGAARAFPGWSHVVSLIPGMCGVYIRRAFYRLVFRDCGSGACINFGTVFSDPGCSIGRDAYIGVFCCLGQVTIGDNALIASHVSITNGAEQHGSDRLDIPMREQPGKWPHVTIGPDTWIGDRAVVMADVGAHCIIGAGAVVTKPIPDFAIAVGVPAEVVRFRGPIVVGGKSSINDLHAVEP
jgi:virginiamycin A acetyltransferase